MDKIAGCLFGGALGDWGIRSSLIRSIKSILNMILQGSLDHY